MGTPTCETRYRIKSHFVKFLSLNFYLSLNRNNSTIKQLLLCRGWMFMWLPNEKLFLDLLSKSLQVIGSLGSKEAFDLKKFLDDSFLKWDPDTKDSVDTVFEIAGPLLSFIKRTILSLEKEPGPKRKIMACALTLMGFFNEFGMEGDKKITDAIDYYQQALKMEADYPPALHRIACCYLLLGAAANSGDGLNCTDNESVELTKAYELFAKCASEKLNYLPSMYSLSVCYAEGKGTKKDHKQSEAWKQKADAEKKRLEGEKMTDLLQGAAQTNPPASPVNLGGGAGANPNATVSTLPTAANIGGRARDYFPSNPLGQGENANFDQDADRKKAKGCCVIL